MAPSRKGMVKKGFSLTELIVTMIIVGVLSTATFGVFVAAYKFFILMPRKINVINIGNSIMDEIVDGALYKNSDDASFRSGARYAVEIKDASKDRFTYSVGYPSNTDKRNIRIELSGDKIYRSYTPNGADLDTPPSYDSQSQPLPGSTREKIPYYAGSDVVISGGWSADPTEVFKYFKANGDPWAPSGSPPTNLSEIRRIDACVKVSSGSGADRDEYKTAAGIDINQYM